MHSMALLEANDTTRLLYFNSTSSMENGVKLNKVAVRNDASPYGPVEFDDSFGGISSNKLGKLSLAELDSKKDYIQFEILSSSPDYRIFDKERFMNSECSF